MLEQNTYLENIKDYYRRSLVELVNRGTLYDVGNEDECFLFNDATGNMLAYYTKTGLVTRTDAFDNQYTFGEYKDSGKKNGYLCVEMVIPFDRNEHSKIRREQIIFNNQNIIVGVQYTCYIHQIASVIKDKLNGLCRDGIANHKDGCPLNNKLDNIETVTHKLNTYHGVIINSILHNKNSVRFIYGIRSNKKYTFEYTDMISAYDVMDYMELDDDFNEEVKNVFRSRISKDGNEVYLSIDALNRFYNWLISNFKISLGRDIL